MAGLFIIGRDRGIPRRVAARPCGAAGDAGRASRPLAARLIDHCDLALSRVLTRRTGPIKIPHQNGAFSLAEREGYLPALRLAPSGLPALPAGRRGRWPLGTNPVEGSHPPTKRALKMTKPNRMAGLFNIGGEGGIRTLGGPSISPCATRSEPQKAVCGITVGSVTVGLVMCPRLRVLSKTMRHAASTLEGRTRVQRSSNDTLIPC